MLPRRISFMFLMMSSVTQKMFSTSCFLFREGNHSDIMKNYKLCSNFLRLFSSIPHMLRSYRVSSLVKSSVGLLMGFLIFFQGQERRSTASTYSLTPQFQLVHRNKSHHISSSLPNYGDAILECPIGPPRDILTEQYDTLLWRLKCICKAVKLTSEPEDHFILL